MEQTPEKQRDDEQATFHALPTDKLKLLRAIHADVNQSYSRRCDARRLIDLFDIYPRDFPREFSEFIETQNYE